MCPLWERDIDLLATQRCTVLLQSLKVTALYECSVRCTFCRTLVLSSCRDLQNFKPVESDDVQQNFWSSGFFGTWSSESSSLRTLETFIKTSVFRIFSTWSEAQSSEAGTVHQNFLSQSLQCGFWENLWSYQKLTIFWSETRLQKRFEWCLACAFNFWWSDFCLRFRICSNTQKHTLEYQNCSFN